MSTPSLADIQNQWFDWLDQDQPAIGERFASAHTDHPRLGKTCLNNARLDIYRNNRFQVLLQTLQQHYPQTLALVGGDYFKQLVRLYSRQQPPTQRNLHTYGLSQYQGLGQAADDTTPERHTLSFSQFLHANQDIQSRGLVYLAPLAELESALQRAYFASNDSVWDGEGFAQLSPNTQMRCQLQLSHSLTLLDSRWDLEAIINSITPSEERVKSTQKTLQLHTGDFYFVVYRHTHKPQFYALSGNEYRALTHLRAGGIELADWLQQHTSAAASLAQWISRGWISHFIRAAQDDPNHAG